MSRYHLESSSYADIIVGWDAPLGTFFLQVWENQDDDEPVLWIGTELSQLPSIESLQTALADYCSLLLAIEQQLMTDKDSNPFTEQRPGLCFVRHK